MNLTENRMRAALATWLPWAILFGAWIMMLLLVDPRGEFPLNDDWAYSRAVKTLHDTGALELPSEWASMTLVAHVAWGWVLTLPFGFSFFVLRLGTLLPAAAGIIGIYVLLKDARVSRPVALIGAAATAFNPVYAQLTVSFMTDIPFFAAVVWSAIFFLRALRGAFTRNYAIAVVLSLVAIMIRQHGVFLAVAWAVVYVRSHEPFSRRRVVFALLPLALQLLYLTVHHSFLGPILGSNGVTLELQNWWEIIRSQGWPGAFREGFLRIAAVMIYFGILTVPLWIYGLFTRRLTANLLLFAVLAVAIPLLAKPYVPGWFHIVYDLGVGPPTLRDVYLLGLPNLPAAPRGFWIAFNAVGIFGALILVARWLEIVPHMWRRIISPEVSSRFQAYLFFTIVSAGCVFLIPLLPFFDRYMIPFIPLLFLLAAPRGNEAPFRPALAVSASLMVLFVIGAYATTGIHDYFAWNRARWTALEWVTTTQLATPGQIDGGFEYHGWNTYDPNYQPDAGRSWWWVADDEYLITFGSVPGFETIREFSYSGWLPPGERSVRVLRRSDLTFQFATK